MSINIHNIQSVIILWAISFKLLSIILWLMLIDAVGSARKFIKIWGTATGITGLILLSCAILLNM